MNEINNDILEQYKQYDYLNQGRVTPLIKILVSYIKPSFLFKSEILTPIHLGRAVERENSKDGVVSDEDIKWLHENCIGDDDFEGNISKANRRVGFLTGTYWAWKNYEKLGNPEYFGSFGYRKFLEKEALENIEKYDCIIPFETILPFSVSKHFIIHHSIKNHKKMVEALQLIYPSEFEDFNIFLSQNRICFNEIYIFKKNIFFEFCYWIFPLLQELLKTDDYSFSLEEKIKLIRDRELHLDSDCNINNFDIFFLRSIGFIIERYTAYYIYSRILNKNFNYKKVDTILLHQNQIFKNRKDLIFKLLKQKMKVGKDGN